MPRPPPCARSPRRWAISRRFWRSSRLTWSSSTITPVIWSRRWPRSWAAAAAAGRIWPRPAGAISPSSTRRWARLGAWSANKVELFANGGTPMPAGESALVPISPDDSIEAIASRIRDEGATQVQLLVPDGTAALQSLGGFQRLLQKLAADHISLLLISSD